MNKELKKKKRNKLRNKKNFLKNILGSNHIMYGLEKYGKIMITSTLGMMTFLMDGEFPLANSYLKIWIKYQKVASVLNRLKRYGELRIYASTTKEAHDVISKYETISRNVCIYCGKPNVGYTKKGWITPVCRKCFYKNKWNRDINYEESIDMENVTIAKEYKYTRFSPDGDKTFTVDISDTVNKILERWNKRHVN